MEDTIYLETSIAGSNASTTYVLLKADGVAHSLGSRVSGPGVNYQTHFTPSAVLTYVYTPPTQADPARGTLQFTGGSGAPLGGVLTFSEDSKSGSISLSTSFQLKTRFDFNSATNVSCRFWIRAGESPIAGFVLDKPRMVVARAVGPGLVPLEVPTVALDPSAGLYTGATLAEANEDWGSGSGPDARALAWLFEIVGAFPLEEGSKDAVVFSRLGAGSHTVRVGVPNTAEPGEVLAEVYVLPFD